jgi:Putative nuclear envelope organisation protein
LDGDPSWTESSLKSFLDHHNIPCPQPRRRDSLLATARHNYDAISKKVGQYASYPGDWLYGTWSESDLKEFLDSRGIPAPQPSSRDRLIASVRRNARLASLNMSSASAAASSSAASVASAASASASSAQAYLSENLFDAWSESKLKEFLDEHGIPVPQGSKKNELIALARKHRAQLTGSASSVASAASSSGVSGYNAAKSSASSGYGAASSKAGNEYAKATDDASAKAEDMFDSAVASWSDSRLKAFLDARAIPVPQGGKRNELLAKVRLNKHKAATGWSAWTFDTWSVDNLRKYLSANSKKAKKNAAASRDELVKSAQDTYASASKSGGSAYASVTNYLASQTAAAKDATFDTWSDSDLKSYLDSYGVPNYQGSTTNELRAKAREHATYFKYGTSTPQETVFERIKGGVNWLLSQLQLGAAQGKVKGQEAADSAASRAASATSSIKKEL